MLRRISEPLAFSEASLLALRPALNAPVLNVEFLPVGPARAAIIVFAEEYGGVGMALGIRSTEAGQVAVFRNRESLDETQPIPQLLEPVLAYAERMGFLFDEDMLEATPGGQGRAQATSLWGRLMGDVAMPPPPKAVPPCPAATEPILELDKAVEFEEDADLLELMLDDVSLDDESLSLEIDGESGQADASPDPNALSAEVAAAQAVSLSKFRQPDENANTMLLDTPVEASGEQDASADDGGPALGRVPLVKVRRERGDGKRLPYLARLLSSF